MFDDSSVLVNCIGLFGGATTLGGIYLFYESRAEDGLIKTLEDKLDQ